MLSDVGHDAIAILRDAQVFGNALCSQMQTANQCAVFLLNVMGGRNVFFGDNQHMYRRLWLNVLKREYVIGFVYFRRRYFTRNNFTE